MIGIERFCLPSPHTLVLGDSVSGRPWPSVRELGPAPCLLGNWRRMPHPTTQHRCLKQEHPASVSSALIDVIDLVPRQDDSEGQQDKHPGNGPPGVPPLRADRRTSESRLGRRVHFLLNCREMREEGRVDNTPQPHTHLNIGLSTCLSLK